jgi:Pyruvate/2-oxoacid:ferredoxin oxidoreductase delta subunit
MALKKSTTSKPNSLKKVYSVERMDCAQIERSHALVDGLFKPIDHKVKRPSFHIRYQMKSKQGKAIALEWRGIQLDITDQQVLLAILRIVSETSRQVPISKIDKLSLIALTDNFEFEGTDKATLMDTLTANTSLTEICKVAGMKDSGQNIEAVYQSIHRMQCTRCWIYVEPDENIKKRTEIGFSLISHWGMKEGNAYIRINPFLSKAILGSLHVTHLDMTHIRSIRGEIGKKLFLWLSAWASYDRTQSISLDKLVGHVWGDSASDNLALKKRRVKLRYALTSVGKLEGWSIQKGEQDDSIFNIRKPKYI